MRLKSRVQIPPSLPTRKIAYPCEDVFLSMGVKLHVKTLAVLWSMASKHRGIARVWRLGKGWRMI